MATKIFYITEIANQIKLFYSKTKLIVLFTYNLYTFQIKNIEVTIFFCTLPMKLHDHLKFKNTFQCRKI